MLSLQQKVQQQQRRESGGRVRETVCRVSWVLIRNGDAGGERLIWGRQRGVDLMAVDVWINDVRLKVNI